MLSLAASTLLFLALLVIPAHGLGPESTGSPPPSKPCPDMAPGPVPLSELVQTLQPLNAVSDLAAESTIRNTLALYPLAIDTRTFSALDRIFSTDARANYSYPLGVMQGREAIKTTLQQALETTWKGTQHMYGTQIIQVCSPMSAISVTYYTASHFLVAGTGPEALTGPQSVVYAYGQYQDTWERQGGEDGWRITNRNLVYLGPLIADAPLGNSSNLEM
ncbi:hypothetical protein PG993_009329 [Apiospora rasikravindrae]|uniref:SnoaL-like domain-containing protein n=1 Tax=Apiospora rasikravindrae TaxID=990691 RepID=A0ABR1SJ34_9PEZI